MKEAKNDKVWAEKTQHDSEWAKKASEVSKDMLHERLEKSTEQLAKEKYDYLKYRANAKGKYYSSDVYIDESAREKWLKLTKRKSQK